MSDGIAAVLFLVVVAVLVGATFFGVLGAVCANTRCGSPALGFSWGALLGPIGVVVILVSTRPTGQPLGDSADRPPLPPPPRAHGAIGLDDLPD